MTDLTATSLAATSTKSSLLDRFCEVRRQSDRLSEPLEVEDFVLQSMPDASPTRWHLAHTTWFFETFALKAIDPKYQSPQPEFEFLFNSYYNTVGEPYPRAKRGLVSRPTVSEVFEYRHHVDLQLREWLKIADPAQDAEALRVIELGLHHEQQHQELMLTDIKHALFCNPLYPAYQQQTPATNGRPHAAGQPFGRDLVPELAWHDVDEQLAEVGHQGDGFHFDNESPRHRTFIHAHRMADRLVTNGEYLQFIENGAYGQPQWWLSAGWDAVRAGNWQAPLYWVKRDGEWHHFTLHGLRPLDPTEPVCHVSYFEADAFARWAGARLPTEAEWEVTAATQPIEGNFAESNNLRPLASLAGDSIQQLHGDVWEWTASQYTAYPGYQPPEGALGEYNGKFMCNQFVLRGGSCATPLSHIRSTYRNFFPPHARWQFTGIRLAR